MIQSLDTSSPRPKAKTEDRPVFPSVINPSEKTHHDPGPLSTPLPAHAMLAINPQASAPLELRLPSVQDSPRPTTTAATPTNSQPTKNTNPSKLTESLKTQLLETLDDPKFLQFLLDNPQTLEHAVQLKPQALRELGLAIPNAKLSILLRALARAQEPSLLAWGFQKALEASGSDLEEIRTTLSALSKPIHKLSRDPKVRAILHLAIDSELKLGTLAQTLEAKLSIDKLYRLQQGEVQPQDLTTILNALLDASPKKALNISFNDDAGAKLFDTLGLPKNTLKKLQLSATHRLTLTLGSAKALRLLGLPDSLAGGRLKIRLNPKAHKSGIHLIARLDFRTALKALFTTPITQRRSVDILMRIAAALLFPLTFFAIILFNRIKIEAQGKEIHVRHAFFKRKMSARPPTV